MERDIDIVKEVIKKLLKPGKDSVNTGVAKLRIIEEIRNFLEKYLYPIVVDDWIFNKEDQPEILRGIDRELERLESLLSYPWMHGKVKIAFAGKFSSGKSSMINTLLNTDTLPTDITPTTAIPTHITYIPNTEPDTAYAVNRDGSIVSIPIEVLKKIKHESKSNKSEYKPLQFPELPSEISQLLSEIIKDKLLQFNEFKAELLQSLIDSVIISYRPELPSEIAQLLSKIIIIDTPGYNPSSQNIDRELSLKALKGSDVVFWIVDIEDGDISRDALSLLKNELEDKEKYIVINKADRKPPSARKKIKDKIANTLENANIKFEDILFFSSKREKDKCVFEIANLFKKFSDYGNMGLPFIDPIRFLLEGAIDRLMKRSRSISSFAKKEASNLIEKIEKRLVDQNAWISEKNIEIIRDCLQDELKKTVYEEVDKLFGLVREALSKLDKLQENIEDALLKELYNKGG